MPFTYDPHIEEREFPVLAEGDYQFEVVSVKEGVSSNTGKDMLIFTINVFDNEGAKWNHNLYVVDKTRYQLKKFWESVGEPEMFEKLANNPDVNAYAGKCGMLRTRIEKSVYQGKDQKKSVINYFIKKEDAEKINPVAKPPADDEFKEEELPF